MDANRASSVVLGLLMLVAFVHLYRKGAGTSFYFDEWDFILDRTGNDAGSFLEPHNEHLSIVPVAIYKVLFATAGLDDYGAYRAVALLLHLICAGLVYTFARPRVGSPLGVVLAALLLFAGAGFIDVLWPFQIGYLLSLCAGLGALLLLERGTGGADVAASALLLIGIGSSGIGIPVALGAALYLAVQPDRRRLWVIAMPIALYALWYLGYGKSAVKRENFTSVPGYTADEVAGALGGVSGLNLEWGRVLAVGAIGYVAFHLATARHVAPMLAALLVTAVAFWLLNATARAHLAEPASPRYVYVGALFSLVIAAELLRGLRPSRRVMAIVAVFVGAAILSGLGHFQRGAKSLRDTDEATRAELRAVELARGHVAPDFKPDDTRMPQVDAGSYLRAVEHYGESPADSTAEIAGRPDDATLADKTLVSAYGVLLTPTRGGQAGAPPRAATPGATTARGCVTLAGRPGADSLDVVLPRTGLALRAGDQAPAAVSLRRFAPTFPEPIGSVAPGGVAALRIPGDSAREPWHVRLTGATTLTACGLQGGTP